MKFLDVDLISLPSINNIFANSLSREKDKIEKGLESFIQLQLHFCFVVYFSK